MHITHKQITAEVCETFGSAFVKVLLATQLDFNPSIILAVALVKAEVVPISAVEGYLLSQGFGKLATKHFTDIIEILLNKCENLTPEAYQP